MFFQCSLKANKAYWFPMTDWKTKCGAMSLVTSFLAHAKYCMRGRALTGSGTTSGVHIHLKLIH